MYVALQETEKNPKPKPIFFSEGLFKAKKDLKCKALQVLQEERDKDETEKPIILSFNFSLSLFPRGIVARYADAKEHSIEILTIDTIDTGYFVSNKVQQVSRLHFFYFEKVNRFTKEMISLEQKEASIPQQNMQQDEFIHFDHVLEELTEKIKTRKESIENSEKIHID